jgi:hypothetical protein
MIKIVLNDEQAEILSHAQEPVNVVDRSGRDLGKLVPSQLGAADPSRKLDPEVEEALRRMEDAKSGERVFYTTQEVLDHLQSLEPS